MKVLINIPCAICALNKHGYGCNDLFHELLGFKCTSYPIDLTETQIQNALLKIKNAYDSSRNKEQ